LPGGLKDLGLLPGDRVAIMSNTRHEWAMTDIANLGMGAITVPIYQSNTAEDTKVILNNSGAKFLFCENDVLLEKWKTISTECPSVEHVICFEDTQNSLSLKKLKEVGEKIQKKDPDFFKTSCQNINPEDVATIVYTSGTTGVPKGAILTHSNIVSEMVSVFKLVGITHEDTTLTFLPYAHIVARAEHFAHIYRGHTMGYAENIDRIRANLVDIKPTFIVSVPRIFEKILLIYLKGEFEGIIVTKNAGLFMIFMELGQYQISLGRISFPI
jgi:long-chain acyl-CoA synthetase